MEQKFIVNEEHAIRTAYDSDRNITLYSVIDVIDYIYDYEMENSARNRWAVLKHRLKKDPRTARIAVCEQAKMRARDGKMRNTDVVDYEQLVNIVNYLLYPTKLEYFRSCQGAKVSSPREVDALCTVQRILLANKETYKYQ